MLIKNSILVLTLTNLSDKICQVVLALRTTISFPNGDVNGCLHPLDQLCLIVDPSLNFPAVFMQRFQQTRAISKCLAIISIITLSMAQDTAANTLEYLQQRLPKHANGWTAEQTDRVYDEKTIFSYINGGAEVYKAYNLQRCLSRRYTISNGPAIVLDIFDMGSSQDAFGVFTHDTDGDVVDVGQDARLRPGWLSFWKHHFFVSIYVEEDTPAAQNAVRELAGQVAAGILEDGSKPQVLSRLPIEGLQSKSIRYLHHPVVLNYHYYVSDKNILNISASTEVVLAAYTLENQNALFLLAVYPEAQIAAESRASFLKHYLPDADQTGAAKLENGKWAAIKRKKRLLAIVLEADSRNLAEHLLRNVNIK